MNNIIKKIKDVVLKDKDVLSVLLFGSHAKKQSDNLSDIDICLVLNSNNYSQFEMSRKRLEYLKHFPNVDFQIFQKLPLYIKVRILKEGKILLCKSEEDMYEAAFSIITEYSDFDHIYKYYLKELQDVG